MLELENIIEQIKDKREEKAQLEQLLEDKVKQLKSALESKTEQIDKDIYYLTQTARAEFEKLPSKVAKTQRKISLLSGDIVIKNATQKFDYDKSVLLNFAEEKEKQRVEKLSLANENLRKAIAKCEEVEKCIFEDGVDDKLIKEHEIAFAEKGSYLEEVERYAEPSYYEELIKTKTVTTKDFDWASYKKILSISEGKVIDAYTGEVVTEGVSIVDVPEEVVIK